MKKSFSLLTFILIASLSAFGQAKQLDLQTAVRTALLNNLQLQQQKNSQLIARENKRQSIHDFAPNLNANLNYSQEFGQEIIDNFSFQQTSGRITSSASLMSSWDLFKGLSRYYTLKQRLSESKSSEYGLKRMENDITSTVVLYYFQVVFDQENLKLIEDRRSLVEKQIRRAEKQKKAGLITEGDLLALKSQGAAEELNYINQQNMLARDLLNLIQYLNIDPSGEYEVALPSVDEIDPDNNLPDVEKIYSEAVRSMPEMKEQEENIKASDYAFKAARGAYLPNISFNASYNTWFASTNMNRPIIDYDTALGVVFPVYGDPENIPFFKQYGDNSYFRIGLSLNVPIYNRYQVRRSHQIAKINKANAELAYTNAEQMLVKKIQQAYLDVNGSLVRFRASKKQIGAATEAFAYSEKKFNAGLIDFYTYLESLNNKTRAESEVIQSRYDYILKSKILDIYQGKPLKF